MDYLLSPIRRELEARVGTANASFMDFLVIDFANSDLLQDNPGVQCCSLLGSGASVSKPRDDFDLQDQSFDCVVVNLQSSWLSFEELIARVRRLLRPGGVLYFSAFGPDTLSELRYAWAKADDFIHVHPFVDMHHLGDALLQAGFTKPVVDADWVNVDYPNVDALFEDLQQQGFTNIHSRRRKTLTGKHRFARFKQALKQAATTGERMNITFEIIYGFAGLPNPSGGSIRVRPPRLP